MRFIGSKTNLLPELESFIGSHAPSNGTFCDIFSGTGAVARHFKSKYRIISNDVMRFSHVLQSASIELGTIPTFDRLSGTGIEDPIDYLNTAEIYHHRSPFITNNYAPSEGCDRRYLSTDNARRIDFIRQQLDIWREQDLVSYLEFNYLLACLIEAVPYVSNIAGTYGAYLKHWDNRALKRIELKNFTIEQNVGANESFNEKSEFLIERIEGDILYLDPPYNSRQYLPNYHLLETIACYDYPEISGKTGMRTYTEQKSKFCSKRSVASAFEEIITKAKFQHIFISYSSEGLMSREDLLELLQRYSTDGKVGIKEIPYRRYKHTKTDKPSNLFEYIFHMRKL